MPIFKSKIDLIRNRISNGVKRFLAGLSRIKLPKCSLSKCRVKSLSQAPTPNKILVWGQAKVNPIFLVVCILVIFVLGFSIGAFYLKEIKGNWAGFTSQLKDYFINKGQKSATSSASALAIPYSPQTPQEQAVIDVVKKSSSSVVSIVISKDVPVYEQYLEIQPFNDAFGNHFEVQVPKIRQKGTQKQTVGEGTGFIISDDGMILTNKHVVSDKEANYTVVTSEGKKYSATVLAKDPLQDLAIIAIDKTKQIGEGGQLLQEKFSVLHFGDSNSIQIGQTVIAIGNALGEFNNSVSVGVISGVGRRITASGGGMSETLEDILQTDAAINKGNSGGPLLNLKGEVIGINAAIAEGAQDIGFAIPINKAKRDVRQVKAQGKIVYPFLGVRYVLITPEIQQANQLSVDYGVLIVGDQETKEPAVIAGSAADKAGIKENDIILEADGVKITTKTPLSQIVQEQHIPGDKVVFKILRNKKEMTIEVILGEKTSE
ncbi:MAG: trypsin-like peptidase domain-containing protein [Candidatus Pacebacteria bacterium]|nr:trypsin-like peptidase domain-containing protein [Candidatus Paceibacterota bacterium]